MTAVKKRRTGDTRESDKMGGKRQMKIWQSIRDGAVQFAESYNGDGGDCTVVNLPDEGITRNSHFMFQELNNDVIADNIEAWLKEKGLG